MAPEDETLENIEFSRVFLLPEKSSKRPEKRNKCRKKLKKHITHEKRVKKLLTKNEIIEIVIIVSLCNHIMHFHSGVQFFHG